MRLKILAAVVASALCSSAQAVSTGDTVTCSGTLSFSCSPTATVDAGREFTLSFVVTDAFAVDFAPGSLTISHLPNRTLLYGPGFIQSFSDLTNPISAFSLTSASGVTGFDASNISLANGLLTIDFGGARFTPTGTVTIALAESPVPEPMTWGMMLVGFGLLGVISRQRCRAVVAC